MALSSDEPNSDTIFFLGAGASIDAGFLDVVRLKDEFLKWLKKESKTDSLFLSNVILNTVRSWKAKRPWEPTDLDIDIELLLEVVERIENKGEDPLSEFYDDKILRLEKNPANVDLINKRMLSKELKTFIKVYFNRTDIQTDYLQYLKEFLIDDKPLEIFSTNYDICIEQVCKKNEIRFIDTFDPKLKTQTRNYKVHGGIILCKLHGSITWYRTEQGDYILSDIMSTGELKDVSGQPMVPLILYPGKKFEFFGPLFDNLVRLNASLKTAKHVIVVGYSFKDPHIAKIFDLAARENKDLLLFLISPSACKIYEEKLEAIYDPEFPHGFTHRGFTDGYDKHISSNLKGRVIPLPYKFAKIFPSLKLYIEKLELARKKDKELTAVKREAKSRIQEWRECLRLYVDCEYMTRASEIVEEARLENFIQDNWSSIFEIIFRGILNAIACDDVFVTTQWKDCWLGVCESFAVDKFSFDPMIEDNIRLDTISNIPLKNFATSLDDAIQVAEKKLEIINVTKIDRIKKLKTKAEELRNYLEPWLKGKLTYKEYYNMRKSRYPEEIQSLQAQIPAYRHGGHEDLQIRELIDNIERTELQRIYGGRILALD